MDDLVSILELAWYELALLAACGVILLGADDVLVDLFCFVLRRSDPFLAPGQDSPPLKLAIFVPAWDEANVIGHMISACKARWNDEGWVMFVGCYPNDPATRLAILPETGARVVLEVNEAEGPTTKADCLNALWRGLRRYEHAHGTMFDAIVLHDAEDLADPWELQVYRHGLQQFDMVQIPVCPLTSSPLALIAGHYLDEFAEAHGKDLVVRSAIGAGLPSAGVGSAIRRQALARLAEANAEGPFDAASLTEDYELGLRLKECGCSSAFLRLRNPDDGRLIAVRAYFPDTLETAVRQKCRWIAGIALAGWDRLGWRGGLGEWWMRWRDRRSLLAALIILASYATLTLALLIMMTGEAITAPTFLQNMLTLSAFLLAWRLACRIYWTWRAAGPFQAILAIPRVFISNIIAIMAGRRALTSYLESQRNGRLVWNKTQHRFPDESAR